MSDSVVSDPAEMAPAAPSASLPFRTVRGWRGRPSGVRLSDLAFLMPVSKSTVAYHLGDLEGGNGMHMKNGVRLEVGGTFGITE